MAGSVIQAGTIIKKNTIINSRASIDHDCIIEENVHIAPRATILCGNVNVGNNTFIGAGSIILPGAKIEKNKIIPAGNVIKKLNCNDNKKKILAVIPARSGSVGLLDKNILPFGGKPLIAHTINIARKSIYIDHLICSTDSEKIKKIALKYKCSVPFLRPKYLSTNKTSMLDVLFHLTKKFTDYFYLVLLQPTSPLRTTSDIDEAIKKCEKTNAFSVVSVNKMEKSSAWMFNLNQKQAMLPIFKNTNYNKRRRDLRDTYILNGAVYVIRYSNILKKLSFINNKTVALI